MTYYIMRPGNIEVQAEFVCSLSKIADRAWRGYNKHDLSWRLRYYTNLSSDWRIAEKTFRLIVYLDEKAGKAEVCAFMSILPVREDIYTLHMEGGLSQYKFTGGNLIAPSAHSKKTHHFFQSLFVEKSHRNGFYIKKLLRESILELLKEQYCGHGGRPYLIYAETSLEPGQALATARGMFASNRISYDGHPFYTFDSSLHRSEINDHVSGLWNGAWERRDSGYE